jgi:hypothetical protein
VGNILMGFGIVVFLLFLATTFYIYHCRESGSACGINPVVLGGLWVIGPPVWFFLEHVYIFRIWGDPDQYEQFKRLQDLAGKIWAGVIIFLVALYAGQFPG